MRSDTISYLKTDTAPPGVGPYSQAVIANGLMFISGQLGMVPSTGELIAGNAARQAEQALKNLSAILVAAGCDWTRVLKCTLYLSSMEDFDLVNEVYEAALGKARPARAAIAAAALPRKALIEIEAIALL